MVSAINAALWERRPAAIISDMLCKYRGETPLSHRWMAETRIKAGFFMRWAWKTWLTSLPTSSTHDIYLLRQKPILSDRSFSQRKFLINRKR
jgi:hypothetical protein